MQIPWSQRRQTVFSAHWEFLGPPTSRGPRKGPLLVAQMIIWLQQPSGLSRSSLSPSPFQVELSYRPRQSIACTHTQKKRAVVRQLHNRSYDVRVNLVNPHNITEEPVSSYPLSYPPSHSGHLSAAADSKILRLRTP